MASRYKNDKRYQQRVDKVRWSNWTPTATGGGNGVAVSITVHQARYKRDGTTVHVMFDLTVNALNGATGNLDLGGLPYATYGPVWMGVCREVAVNGSSGTVHTTGTVAIPIFYNGTSLLAAAYRIVGSVTYEINSP